MWSFTILYLIKLAGALFGTLVGCSTNVADIIFLHRRGQNTWQRYGAIVLLVVRGAVEQHLHIEHILKGTDQDLIAYKDAYVSECSMIAVAAAIIAQVAITGLQFPYIAAVHWLAPAFFIFSLVVGCFCIYTACAQQRLISNLSTPEALHAWLGVSMPFSSSLTNVDGHGDTIRASTPAVLTLTAPRTLFDHSLRFFIAGLAVYLGCIYTGDLESTTVQRSTSGSRNIFIVFWVAVLVGMTMFVSPSSYKNYQRNRREIPNHSHDAGITGVMGMGTSKGVENDEASRGEKFPIFSRSTTAATLRVDMAEPESRGTLRDREATLPLLAALKIAADAHRRCAEALRYCAQADGVAMEYERLAARA